MSQRTFYQITQDEFETALGMTAGELVSGLAFLRVPVKGTFENVYEANLSESYAIRIYSSIESRSANHVARDCGEDAIRICHVFYNDKGNPRIVGTEKRINRIQTWKKNLLKRIQQMASEDVIACPVCGSPMKLRSGSHGKFFGCTNFPQCKGTRNVER